MSTKLLLPSRYNSQTLPDHLPYLTSKILIRMTGSYPPRYLPIYSLNAPRAFHSKRFNLEMNAGGVLFYLTPGAAYRENLGPT